MYTPAFFEVFVGLVVVVVWARLLADRPTAPRAVALVPWVVSALVLLGQVAAGLAVVMAGAGGATGVGTLVEGGRWGSFVAVIGGAVALVVLTAITLLRRPSPPGPTP